MSDYETREQDIETSPPKSEREQPYKVRGEFSDDFLSNRDRDDPFTYAVPDNGD